MPSPIEQAATKIAGAAKATKATFEGLQGVFRKLAQEHGEVSALMLRVKNSSDPSVRDELFPKIRAELLSHERGELEVVYPKLAQHAQTQHIATEHERDAGDLRQQLEALAALGYEDAAWMQAFERLFETVQNHAKTEEQAYFPEAQEALGGGVSNSLQERFETVKKRALGELS